MARRIVIRVVIAIALLVVLDRLALHFAERDVAKRLQADAHTSSTPHVTIHNFPFLTQLISGTFADVDIDMHGVQASAVHISRLTIQIHDAHVSIGDVITQSSSKIHVKHATAQMVMAYDDIAQALPAAIRSRETVNHSLIQSASVTGPQTISLRTRFGDFPLQLRGLPFAIRLTGAKATETGVVVDGEAQGLVING
jgi:hypothetical protein